MHSKLFDDNLEWAAAVARNVHRKIPPSFDLSDLEQVARIEMWKRCGTYDPLNEKQVPFRAYAHVYVRGAVLMFIRRKNWREQTADPLSESMVCSHPTPDAQVLQKRQDKIDGQKFARRRDWLKCAIDELPALDAYLVKRHHVEGVDLDELVVLVGIPRKQLWRRLSGIVRQLKKMRAR